MVLDCLSADDKLQYSGAFIIHPGNCGLQLRNVELLPKEELHELTHGAGLSVKSVRSDL